MLRLKRTESEFIAQMQTMIDQMDPAILDAAGVNRDDWEAVAELFQQTVESIDFASEQWARAQGATIAKNEKLNMLRAQTQSIIDKFYATPAVSGTELKNIALPAKEKRRNPTVPIEVSDLVTRISSNLVPVLKWKRNGNTPTTIFEVQVLIDGQWRILGTTLATKFVDRTSVPGEQRHYRVISKNSRGESTPSNTATVYSQARAPRAA